MGRIYKIEKYLFLFIITLFISNINAADFKDSLIQPGVGVGVLKLGDTPVDISRKLEGKKADIAKKIVYDSTVEMWLSYVDMGVTLIYDTNKSIKSIIVTNKELLLEESGIHVGSAKSNVLKNYKGEKRPIRQINNNIELWEYPDLGIIFFVNITKELVDSIKVIPKR
ncbi:hypothetical protein HY745_00985 [Candidatus Desantisbacteria bacterium]|nr:hypothetical protein [Candidatus Desantisbacteria bacterium]